MNFVIVSYTFPPSKEIGGRRWAKFSQYLSRKGHSVTVICAGNAVKLEWYEKEFPGIEFELLPKHYPEWLTGVTNSVSEKVLYFFCTRILSPLTKQNLFDRGLAWRKPMIRKLEAIQLKKPIDVLVVSGAPFSLLNYGACFKRNHKAVLYVGDLRDPWTWGSYYGMLTLSKHKRNHQEMSEFKALEACDMVCFPTQNMGDFLKKKYPAFSSKLFLLSHAYDPEKFPATLKEAKREGFIYGGNLYDGIEEYLKRLSEIVKANPDIGFKWDIYTGKNYPLIDSNFANGCVSKHSLIPEELLFHKIKSSAAYLAFYPTMDKDLISTKFFEIIYSQTPILYIGEEGEVGRFIRDNHLGVHILPENMERDFPKYLNGMVPYEVGHFDVRQFTFSSVTDSFLIALKDLRASNFRGHNE